MTDLCDKVEGVQQTVGPEIQNDLKQLKADIKQQKFDKHALQKTVQTLLTET
jgi:hypothetical protein